MFGISLFICGFLCLVESQNQYQQLNSYPYGTSYASIYGSQPVIVQQSPYHQGYNEASNRSPYPESFPVTNQLQEIYLKKILSNPSILAFIDPDTRIYNQNGVEISNQIRPLTPNVVNNYFIVPSDYLKINESRAKSKKIRYPNRNNYYDSHPKQYLKNQNVENAGDRNNDGCKNGPKVKKERQMFRTSDQEYKGRELNTKHTLQDTGLLVDDHCATNNKKKCNCKRQNQYSSKNDNVETQKQTNVNKNVSEKITSTKKHRQKNNTNQRRSKDNKKVKQESDNNKSVELFDINDGCCDLDNRNIRNSASNSQNKKSHTMSAKKQNDLMNNWLNYVKMFMPNQNIDSLDFSNFKAPFNYEQMYQTPNLYNTRPQLSKSDKKDKERKQKIHIVKSESNISDGSSNTDKDKRTRVELSPTLVEIESSTSKPVKTNKTDNLLEKSINKKIQQIESNFASEQRAEPVENQNDIIDYYPDFTNDAKYSTDENDLYLFHNRHYYNTDDALNRERRKLDPVDNSFKWSNNEREDDVISFKKRNMKEKTEGNQFRTPPGLKDPGFQTKRIYTKARPDFYSFNADDSNRPDFRPIEKDENNVETVFARSKVVKYGQPIEVEKLKSNSNEANRNERDRNLHSNDGDTTIVFSKSWNP